MKKVMYMILLVIGFITGNISPAKAQVNVSVNISTQPLWGPVGYDYVEYYYFPDMEMYYYVPAHKFVYINGGRWVFASSVPYYYRHYDLYTVHKVVINTPRPYRHFHSHKIKYAKYKGGPHHQVMIRSSNNPKYYVVKGHPHHGRGHKISRWGGKRYNAPSNQDAGRFGARRTTKPSDVDASKFGVRKTTKPSDTDAGRFGVKRTTKPSDVNAKSFGVKSNRQNDGAVMRDKGRGGKSHGERPSGGGKHGGGGKGGHGGKRK